MIEKFRPEGQEESMPPIDDLSEVAARLNDASDRGTERLKEAEEKLRNLNLGIEFYSRRPIMPSESWRDGAENCRKEVRLGFGKANTGVWRLRLKFTTYRHGFFEGDTNSPYRDTDRDEFEAVMESKRELRIAALHHLDEFIGDLKVEAEGLAKIVETATAVKI